MLQQILESILSKLGELIVVCAQKSVNNVNELELSLKTLQKDLKLLSAKAFDVEEEITNAEALGQKKRKREVEEWLVDVDSMKTEVVELMDEVEGAGFIGRMMSLGKARRVSEQVKSLVDQSRHFSELVLDFGGSGRETLTLANRTSTVTREIYNRVVVGLLSSLKTLRIDHCNQISGLPASCLPNLEKLRISGCEGMEDVFEEEGKGLVTLPKLREVKLFNLPRLRSLCTETLICCSIRRILINKCPRLIKKWEISINKCPRMIKKLPLQVEVPPQLSLTDIWVEREWWPVGITGVRESQPHSTPLAFA